MEAHALTNDQMKSGRFLKLYEGRKLYRQIMDTLNAGGIVEVCTPMRATRCTSKHVSCFKLGKMGSVYISRGKSWDCIDHCGFNFYAPKGKAA